MINGWAGQDLHPRGLLLLNLTWLSIALFAPSLIFAIGQLAVSTFIHPANAYFPQGAPATAPAPTGPAPPQAPQAPQPLQAEGRTLDANTSGAQGSFIEEGEGSNSPFDPKIKAYRIPVTVEYKKGGVSCSFPLERHVVQADQGSDTNLISRESLKARNQKDADSKYLPHMIEGIIGGPETSC